MLFATLRRWVKSRTNAAAVSYWCILPCEDDKIPGKATLIYDVELLEVHEGQRPTNFFGEIDTDGDNLLSQDEVTAVMFIGIFDLVNRSIKSRCHR